MFKILVKPRIDRTNLKNIVVRGGKTVKYDVNIKGEPAPTVKWQLVNKEVSIKTIYFNTEYTTLKFKILIYGLHNFKNLKMLKIELN